MKSTYKLLTIYLDRKPIPLIAPTIIDAERCYELDDIRGEPSLLDYVNGNRTISGRWMLYQNDAGMINAYLQRLLNCYKLYCLIDYCSESITANRLFIKRVLQILQILQSANPDKSFSFAASKDNLGQFQRILNELYGC